MENNPAPKQAIRKLPNSERKNKPPIMLPKEKMINTMHNAPPQTVKSNLVWKAKIVKPTTIAAVNPTANKT